MMPPVVLPVSREPVETQPFAEQTHGGLFAAPWLARPTDAELQSATALSRSFARRDLSPADLNAAFGFLMAVRAHCIRAARAGSASEARVGYQEALRACMTAINLLHHASEGPPGMLAAWAQGVHTLIRAQLALPDLAECETLACRAAQQLSAVDDPLCGGAAADCRSATQLARDPTDLARSLESLPARALDKLEYYEYRTQYHESELNQRLLAIEEAYREGLKDTLGWALLNLLLMASLPLNGFWHPEIPWSLPLAGGVLVLWWWTWDRPYREGLRFFDWHRMRRQTARSRFHAAATEFPNPLEQFCAAMGELLREARADRERLAAFHLFDLPARYDTLDDTAVISDEGKTLLTGNWMAELNDRAPWPLEELLPVEPSMLPYVTRIYYGVG